MSKSQHIRRNAKTLKEGIAKAEKVRSVQGRRTDGMVSIKPRLIEMRPELFQMREFSFGLRHTDLEHVKKLERLSKIHGELDAPVVIKLGGKWVCVDGHHRLEAYKRAGRKDPITCEWFAGTVQEAVDELIRLNTKDRRNVTQQERLENAWQHVLMGGYSKAEIVELCGVADGSVSAMRRIKKVYDDKNDIRSKLFRKELGFPLEETRWMQARLAFAGVKPKERDDEENAAKLARRLHSRMTNLLSRDPAVTARALTLYDPALPQALTKAWQQTDPRLKDPDDDDEGSSARASRPLPKGWKPGDPLPDP